MIISQVLNITNEPHQRHQLLYKNEVINVDLRYMNATETWIMDVESGAYQQNGIKLVAGANLLYGTNIPFTFTITVTEDIDPFTLNCFSSSRCKLYFMVENE